MGCCYFPSPELDESLYRRPAYRAPLVPLPSQHLAAKVAEGEVPAGVAGDREGGGEADAAGGGGGGAGAGAGAGPGAGTGNEGGTGGSVDGLQFTHATVVGEETSDGFQFVGGGCCCRRRRRRRRRRGVDYGYLIEPRNGLVFIPLNNIPLVPLFALSLSLALSLALFPCVVGPPPRRRIEPMASHTPT